MDEKPLSPEELLLKSEGESLLRQLSKDVKVSPIVGTDGKPLESKVEPPAASEGAEQRKALEAAKQRVEENSKKINEILKAHPKAALCANSVLQAWRLLYWGMNELGIYEGMTPALLTQISDSMRAAVLSSAGYSVEDLQVALKHHILPFLQERVRYYKAEQGKREKKIEALNKRLKGKGIALPCQSLRVLFTEEKPFGLGRVLVLHGARAAVREALKVCSREHILKNGGHPYYLSAVEGESDAAWASVVMPPSWWRNAASEVPKLNEILQPIVDSHSALVLAEDLEALYLADGVERAPLERKSRALARLYQWSLENLSAFIIGDVTDEDVPDERLYGQLPHAAVALQEFDGRKHVVIGNDPVPLEE